MSAHSCGLSRTLDIPYPMLSSGNPSISAVICPTSSILQYYLTVRNRSCSSQRLLTALSKPLVEYGQCVPLKLLLASRVFARIDIVEEFEQFRDQFHRICLFSFCSTLSLIAMASLIFSHSLDLLCRRFLIYIIFDCSWDPIIISLSSHAFYAFLFYLWQPPYVRCLCCNVCIQSFWLLE